MSTILAIDPGPEQSALLVWDGAIVPFRETVSNFHALDLIAEWLDDCGFRSVVIEGIASYGMAVGKEVFNTCYWIGRFWQKSADLGTNVELVYRRDVKLHHCGSARAKDANVRRALLDKYPAGHKAQPGVSYGISNHLWSAFAIATWYTETKQPQPNIKV